MRRHMPAKDADMRSFSITNKCFFFPRVFLNKEGAELNWFCFFWTRHKDSKVIITGSLWGNGAFWCRNAEGYWNQL